MRTAVRTSDHFGKNNDLEFLPEATKSLKQDERNLAEQVRSKVNLLGPIWLTEVASPPVGLAGLLSGAAR